MSRRERIRQLRANLDDVLKDALAQFCKDNKVSLGLGNARYTDTELEIKLTLMELAKDGSATTPGAEDFKRYAKMFGLTADMLNREFVDGRTKFKIVGLKPRSTTYPVLCENLNTGKIYKFPADRVKNALGGDKRSESEIIDDLRRVECSLSPENLTCDGEIRGVALLRRAGALRAEKDRLIAELGRTPTDRELFGDD